MSLLFRDDRFLEHKTGSHPESPQRLERIHAAIDASDLMQSWTLGTVEPVEQPALRTVHSEDYLAQVQSLAAAGGGRLDPDTVVSARSFEVARCAVGAARAAVDAVLSGQHREAVCLVRPPGHHALPDRAMGFCLLANIALAAWHARDQHGLDRVLIVDWDVHHGNGTQEIFYEDAGVHFFSAHRYPFWPGSGAEDETGRGAGLGATLNLPLPFGITRAQYKSAFEHALETAADRCKPQLVLISAGFDAHRLDPIGSLGLESEDFVALTQMVQDVAQSHCQGRIVSLLEGGYHLDRPVSRCRCATGSQYRDAHRGDGRRRRDPQPAPHESGQGRPGPRLPGDRRTGNAGQPGDDRRRVLERHRPRPRRHADRPRRSLRRLSLLL